MTRLELLWNRYSTMAMFVLGAVFFLVLAVMESDERWTHSAGDVLMSIICLRFAWGERSSG